MEPNTIAKIVEVLSDALGFVSALALLIPVQQNIRARAGVAARRSAVMVMDDGPTKLMALESLDQAEKDVSAFSHGEVRLIRWGTSLLVGSFAIKVLSHLISVAG